VPGPYIEALPPSKRMRLVLSPLKPLALPFLDPLGVTAAVGAAVRPVELQPLAYGATEHLIDRHAERLGLDVDQRVLDRTDGLGVEPARRLAGRGVEKSAVALDRPRVLANEACAQFLDDRGEALRAIPLHEFRPADDALVGRNLEE
jgi:hypothetical protein